MITPNELDRLIATRLTAALHAAHPEPAPCTADTEPYGSEGDQG